MKLIIRTMVKPNKKRAAIKNKKELSSIDPTVIKRKTKEYLEVGAWGGIGTLVSVGYI